ncbi:hypothetical protein [Mariniblastus fucicola]|uniref:Uncharacterized protein n=1 Tax=Mariniblastus fucicola TaxID=980251 RepID=A0A5B9PF18_9BACT|nr:hypothetical protein [Mariniblastus fucicola]QEG24998.1 hypothetical protein MFFC18_49210 [Mariniblastus fucicola]
MLHRSMRPFCFLGIVLCSVPALQAQQIADSSTVIKPARVETIEPSRIESLHAKVKRQRKVEPAPRMVNGFLVFNGATDGDRQVDPQVAVGPNHVVHGTNGGFTIFDKEGNFIDGVSQNGFEGGIDPKLHYDANNGVFLFDLWVYWDKAKRKPVNISVSETDDPTKAWNTYGVSIPDGVDGGAIGYSKRWIGYGFPGGENKTIVMSMDKCKAGLPAEAFHFKGSFGHPVANQDVDDGLYFFKLQPKKMIITKVTAGDDGNPVATQITSAKHDFEYRHYPPKSPQPGTDKTVASGDRNPKNVVLQNGCLWFSRGLNLDGRAAVMWHQVKLDGTSVQSGVISDPKRSFIQSSVAVNAQEDLIVGFQEAGPDIFVSPRFAFRKSVDPKGTLRDMVSIGEGLAATAGGPWGDYSGCAVDGGNGLDLWTVQSVADAEGKGDTVIARAPMNATGDRK